jgi:hypothetical protein
MTEHNPDSENEPVPIGDIVDNPEEVIAFEGDSDREHFIAETDLRHEIMGLEEEALNLIAAYEAGDDIPDYELKISGLNQSLMSARAELNELRHKRPGN